MKKICSLSLPLSYSEAASIAVFMYPSEIVRIIRKCLCGFFLVSWEYFWFKRRPNILTLKNVYCIFTVCSLKSGLICHQIILGFNVIYAKYRSITMLNPILDYIEQVFHGLLPWKKHQSSSFCKLEKYSMESSKKSSREGK